MTYIFLTLLIFFVGCSTNSLPDLGPSRSDILSQAKRSYQDSPHLIKVTNENIAALGSLRIDSINSDFKNVFSETEHYILGLGDQLHEYLGSFRRWIIFYN